MITKIVPLFLVASFSLAQASASPAMHEIEAKLDIMVDTDPGGGIDGGGGDIPEGERAYAGSVKSALLRAIQFLPYVAKLHGMFDANSPMNYPAVEVATRTVFADGGRALIRLADKLTYRFEDKEPCFDRFNQPKLATAFNQNPKEICFSIPLIAQKTRESEVFKVSMGLLVHELCHKRGLFEDMCQIPQKLIQNSTSENLPDTARDSFFKLRDAFRDFEQNVKNISSNFDSRYPQFVCAQILSLNNNAVQIIRASTGPSGTGFTLTSVEDIAFISSPTYRIGNVSAFCIPPEIEYRKSYESIFKGKSSLTPWEYYEGLRSSPSSQGQDKNWVDENSPFVLALKNALTEPFHPVGYFDKESLDTEVGILKRELEKIKVQVLLPIQNRLKIEAQN